MPYNHDIFFICNKMFNISAGETHAELSHDRTISKLDSREILASRDLRAGVLSAVDSGPQRSAGSASAPKSTTSRGKNKACTFDVCRMVRSKKGLGLCSGAPEQPI